MNLLEKGNESREINTIQIFHQLHIQTKYVYTIQVNGAFRSR